MSELRKIALSLIDEPEHAVRFIFDEADMSSLMASMKSIGLQVPIIVRPRGERFEVVAGDRRTKVARLLNWEVIEAIVKEMTDAECMVARYEENNNRVAANPVEEAYWFRELIDKHGWTADMFVEKFKRPEEFFVKRLRILNYDEKMQDAIAEKSLTLAVAEQLMRCPDAERRHMFFYHAVNGEHSARTVKMWIDEYLATSGPAVPQVAPSGETAPQAVVAPATMACVICGPVTDTYNLRSIMIHAWELGMVEQAVADARRKLAGGHGQ